MTEEQQRSTLDEDIREVVFNLQPIFIESQRILDREPATSTRKIRPRAETPTCSFSILGSYSPHCRAGISDRRVLEELKRAQVTNVLRGTNVLEGLSVSCDQQLSIL
jgi:hypothetical protein